APGAPPNTWNRLHGTMPRAARRCSLATSPSIPGEWDARERVGRIDTNRCPLFMLFGEYDYSCTVELSEATAAKIPGVRFQAMQAMGPFPFAETPKRFAEYLLPILAELKS